MDAIMRRLEAIRLRAAEILTELEEHTNLLEQDDLDAETRTATSGHVTELEAEAMRLADERDELEARVEKRARLAAAAGDLPKVPAVEAPTVLLERTGDPYDPDLAARAWSPAAENEVRDAAQKAIERVEAWELESVGDAEQRTQLARRARRNPHISRLILATGSDAYKRAFAKAIVGQHYLMTPDEQAAVSRAMSLTDASGGFAVPFPIDPTLIVTGDGSTNPVRSVARVVDIDTDSWQGVSAGPTSFSWDGEAGEVSDDASTFAQPQVTPYKAQGFVPLSIEIGADYPGLVDDLRMLFAQGKDDLEAVAFITGSGTNQPVGIVTAIDGTGNDISSAAADTFAAGDVYTVHETLGPKYRSRATWLANVAIINDIRQFGTSDPNFTVDMTAAGIPSLFGRPVLEASAMDGVINATAENNVLVFGDFSNYVIADRAGFQVELVPHLFATANNRPSGQRGWYAWWRTGGDSVNDDAFVLLNVT